MGTTTAHLLDSLGWAMIHSLWQGVFAVIAVIIFRAVTVDSQAGRRCAFELFALSACFISFVLTFAFALTAPGTSPSLVPLIGEAGTAVTAYPHSTSAVPELGPAIADYTSVLGLIWIIGFLCLATRYSVGLALTQKLRKYGLSDAPSDWQRKFETLVLNAGIFRETTLYISDRIPAPMTMGFLKPVVLVPASFFSGLPAAQIEAILLHEIAHIRRHDYFINLLQTAVKSALFFHPAIHYICKVIDEDREQACDDFAVRYTNDPASLAKGLATLRLQTKQSDFVMAASHNQSPLLRRLTRLTTPAESRRRPGQVATFMAALVVAAGLYAGTLVESASASLNSAQKNILDGFAADWADVPAPDSGQQCLAAKTSLAPNSTAMPVAKPEVVPEVVPEVIAATPAPYTPALTLKAAKSPQNKPASKQSKSGHLKTMTGPSDPLDRLRQHYETDMAKIAVSFEYALDNFEQAASAQNQDFEQAQQTFTRAMLAANSHQEARTRRFEQEAMRLTELQSRTPGKTLHQAYGDRVIEMLKSDGLIDQRDVTAEISYEQGEMFVNGQIVPHDREGRYCALNGTYNIKKTDNMRIHIAPDNKTTFDYSL